ncbi:MAG: alpha/beta hydrolase, partial [bacterium]|nr:alpha/beta hydrolase [bacterium]
MKKIKNLIKFKKWSVIILLLVAGIVWQYIMVRVEQKKYPPVGQYVDVGTYQAHCYSEGAGDIAFVFITGSGTPCAYTDFYALQSKLSENGVTISFDHAGSGWSEETNEKRSINHLVKELSII